MTPEGHPIAREQMHRIADLDPPRRHACSGGSCRQGRSRCETPEACCTPIDDDDLGSVAKAIAIAVLLPLTLVLAAGGGAWLLTVLLG